MSPFVVMSPGWYWCCRLAGELCGADLRGVLGELRYFLDLPHGLVWRMTVPPLRAG